MAKDKKSVLLYCDIIHTVKELSDEEAGKLFKHYLNYINDLNPEPPDKLTQIVFEPIKQNLKRDLKKWESKSDKNKESAIARWNKQKDANAYERINSDANHADKDKDTVTDKDTVKESVSKEKNAHEFFPNQKVSTAQYFLDLPNSSYFNDFAKDMKVSVEVLKLRIPDFKINCEPEYTSFSKFFFHFKKWYLKTKQSNNKITPLYKSLD